MDLHEIKQQLLHLENRDIIRKWFYKIHHRTLPTSKAMEINSAARQSSEYFKNAASSNYIVRPLLTFYGINSLSRAIVLLLKANGGENTLKNGHGLSVKEWNNTLYIGNIESSLNHIGSLKISTCKGLFTELVEAIKNQVMIHTCGSTVDWSIPYNIPSSGIVLTLKDLISRIPDFENELENIDLDKKYCSVNQLSFNHNDGFNCKVHSLPKYLESYFLSNGYIYNGIINEHEVKCDSKTFCSNTPLFLHKYVNKAFNAIPQLYIVEPFENNICYSEIAICYMVGYILGMLVRYYPTHWNALVNGSSGDVYWPVLNRAQHYVENVFPELIIELINHLLSQDSQS